MLRKLWDVYVWLVLEHRKACEGYTVNYTKGPERA